MGIIYFNGDIIFYSILYDMGMVIDGKIIIIVVILVNVNWCNYLYFDFLKLNDFYIVIDLINFEF